MSSNSITIIGNLAADPELRFIASGDAVVNFTVVDQPRSFNRETNQWQDSGLPLYQRCTAWRGLAENIAASLHKGDNVIVTGRIVARPPHEKDGVKYENKELEVAEIGASLRYATAVMTRKSGNVNNAPAQQGATAQRPAQTQAQPAQTAPPAQSFASDEPPF